MRVKKPLIKNLSSRGSFLISTALFVMAASMFGVLLIQMYRLFDYNKDLQVTQVRLEAVQEALETYYRRNGNRYPCPADPTEPLDTPRFGREASANCAFGLPDGTQRVPGRAGRFVRIGALPVRDLGLSDAYTVDKWGHKLIYAVTENYATATPPASNSDEGAIKIEDAVGNDATSQPENVIYTVLTHGPDKRGAYTLSGQQPIPCPAAGLAAENCDGNDATFVNTTRKNYDFNVGANTYTYTALYRAAM